MLSKYQPLVDHIAAQRADTVTLSFAEIEAIIGAPLSISATIMPDSWHAMTHPHVRRWRALGWRARFDRRNHCVHFARDAEEG